MRIKVGFVWQGSMRARATKGKWFVRGQWARQGGFQGLPVPQLSRPRQRVATVPASSSHEGTRFSFWVSKLTPASMPWLLRWLLCVHNYIINVNVPPTILNYILLITHRCRHMPTPCCQRSSQLVNTKQNKHRERQGKWSVAARNQRRAEECVVLIISLNFLVCV